MNVEDFQKVLSSLQSGDLKKQETIDFAEIAMTFLSYDSNYLNPDNKANIAALLPVYLEFLKSDKIPQREKEINVGKLIKLFSSEKKLVISSPTPVLTNA